MKRWKAAKERTRTTLRGNRDRDEAGYAPSHDNYLGNNFAALFAGLIIDASCGGTEHDDEVERVRNSIWIIDFRDTHTCTVIFS
jgi:hypothetical protein